MQRDLLFAILANMRIRNLAETLQASLNVARSEAIKRNQQVQFLLFGDTNYNSTFVDSVTANSTGPNWLMAFPWRRWGAATARGPCSTGRCPTQAHSPSWPLARLPATVRRAPRFVRALVLVR